MCVPFAQRSLHFLVRVSYFFCYPYFSTLFSTWSLMTCIGIWNPMEVKFYKLHVWKYVWSFLLCLIQFYCRKVFQNSFAVLIECFYSVLEAPIYTPPLHNLPGSHNFVQFLPEMSTAYSWLAMNLLPTVKAYSQNSYLQIQIITFQYLHPVINGILWFKINIFCFCFSLDGP